MRIDSWNVNGILAKVKKGALEPIVRRNPDVICLQEVRTKQEPTVLPGYRHTWNHSERDNFWGTLTLSRRKPKDVVLELGIPDIDREGRLIACEFDGLWSVNVYVPNATGSLRRKEMRREWDEALADFLRELALQKPVVVCGDFNVALTDDDVYEGNPKRGLDDEDGFPSDERSHLAELLEHGYVDGFRLKHPHDKDAYTWWSQRRNRRAVNHGWRLDYFLVSEGVKRRVSACDHLTQIKGSDHCPIEIVVSL